MPTLSRLVVAVTWLLSLPCPAAAQTFRSGAEPAALGRFGGGLAVGESDIFIGEPMSRTRTDGVYVFHRGEDGRWTQAARLAAPDGARDGSFSSAIAVSGSTLVIGAPGAAAAFVYSGSGTKWSRPTALSPADAAQGDSVGVSLAASGELVAVGAPGAGVGGAVYLFSRAADVWKQVAKLVADSAGALFGISLALDGERLVVGAPGEGGKAGAAYLFSRAADGGWTRRARLQPSDAGGGEAYGVGVAIAGDAILVAGPGGTQQTGGVVPFRPGADPGSWEEQPRLQPFVGAPRSLFGFRVSAEGSEVWVAAPAANQRRGAVYRFLRGASGEWEAARILGSDGARRDLFGMQMARRGDVAAIAAPGTNFGSGAVLVFERAADGDWKQTSRLVAPGDNFAAVTGGKVECASGKAGAFDCGQVDLLSFLPVEKLGGARGVEVNDMWGWTDPQTGHEYALVGRSDGTSFIDVSEPSRPLVVGDLPKTEGARGSVWRDIKVYKDHAYVVSDAAGEHGVQIFDLTHLRGLDRGPVTFHEDAHYSRIHSAHNIVIDTATGFAYTVGNSGGGETCGGGLHMIDIRDPEQPKFAGCFSDPTTGRASTGYTHDAECVVYHGPDAGHRGREICLGSNETALSIADVTDKTNPVALARAEYPNVGYTHQGWLTDDQHYFFLDDELDELQGKTDRTRTLIWDVSDLDDPQLVGTYLGTTHATDHNLYIKGDLMYQSDYVAGLRIIDISDPLHPKEVGYFDTVPYGDNTPGFGGSWSNYPFFRSGTIVVTSGNEGVFILRKREPVS